MDGLRDKYQAELSEIALAWTIAQPSISAPIASATSTSQLDALIKAMSLKLEAEDVDLLSKVSQY